MAVIKLYTYTRAFLPWIYQFRQKATVAIFVVVADGKLVKRSFTINGYFVDDTMNEIDAFYEGITWVSENCDNLRDADLHVIFCGTGKNKLKELIDKGEYFAPYIRDGTYAHYRAGYILPLIEKFNKVSYYTSAKVMYSSGDEDDPASAQKLDVGSIAYRLFTMTFGDDTEYKHTSRKPEEAFANARGDVWL